MANSEYDGQAFVRLKASPMKSIGCFMSVTDLGSAAKLDPGADVTVRGVIHHENGLLLVIEPCSIR